MYSDDLKFSINNQEISNQPMCWPPRVENLNILLLTALGPPVVGCDAQAPVCENGGEDTEPLNCPWDSVMWREWGDS